MSKRSSSHPFRNSPGDSAGRGDSVLSRRCSRYATDAVTFCADWSSEVRRSGSLPSRRQLTFISPMTLIVVRQRSRNQSTVRSSTMYSVGSPTAVNTRVMVTSPASGIPAAPTEAINGRQHHQQLLGEGEWLSEALHHQHL